MSSILRVYEPSQRSDALQFDPCPPDPACPYCNGDRMERPAALDWSFVDSVYCTSLKTRDDRAVQAAREFHRVGLYQKLVFYRPLKHPRKGIIGSWESHRAVGMDVLKRGFAHTLILEDDVLFSRKLRRYTIIKYL